MRILFIADPLKTFKIHKDTTYAMMKEMASRGITLAHTLSQNLLIKEGKVIAHAQVFHLSSTQEYKKWFELEEYFEASLNSFDAVIMRTDPPFNMQYLYATQLLTLAEQQGSKVFNNGQAMRDLNEKLAILSFSQWTAPTMVATHSDDIRQFLVEHGDIIIKPLDGMGGMGIFRLRTGDANIGSTLEMLMAMNTKTIMAQRYIPDIIHGDKRIIIIDGEVIPYALARIPQQGETRGNLAVGGQAKVIPLSDHDKMIANDLAPQLAKQGVFLAGLDVIGQYLTEVNVTSPTGFQEIKNQSGCDVAKIFTDRLLQKITY